MKRWISVLGVASIVGLTAFASGQWQVQPQVSTQVGPVYPTNPAYNFYSSSNYNPFQFNWGTGQWDYMPIPPGGSSAGMGSEPALPPVPYGAWPAPQNQPAPGPAHTVNPPPQPDDSELWSGPTTRPGPVIAAKIVKFEGRIVAVKAVNLMGEANAHLLLRVRSDAGTTGTVDAGQCLMFPKNSDAGGQVTATGQLGTVDGHLLLFADQISFGSQTLNINRHGKNPAK